MEGAAVKITLIMSKAAIKGLTLMMHLGKNGVSGTPSMSGNGRLGVLVQPRMG